MTPYYVKKRDGKTEAWDQNKIINAIKKCASSQLQNPPPDALMLQMIEEIQSATGDEFIVSIEAIQDLVERGLGEKGLWTLQKAYILYRHEREKDRRERDVPLDVKTSYKESSVYFPSPLQQFQFYDKYSRYNYEKGRRETWIETVQRAVAYLKELSRNKLSKEDYEDIEKSILNMEVMPSMRLLAMAGEAAHRNNISIYNCSYMGVDDILAFVEAMIISMSGCGVGYSVERYYIDKLPVVKMQETTEKKHFVIPDSSEGWADALKEGLECWFNGCDIIFDYRLIRPAGSPLRIKGGRASGPEPLRFLLDGIRSIILSAQGRKLKSVEVHDIMCMIGGASIAGGMRRSALISLFDKDDTEMMNCKEGNTPSYRWNANNSAVWTGNESQEEIVSLFLTMVKGQRGEPGIFNRDSASKTRPLGRKDARFGTNPCGEIILRSNQFCNLSAVVARPEDTVDSLCEKVRIATIIGTIQSMATDFKGLRPIWQENCEEERLLGVDITGQMDCPLLQNEDDLLILLKDCAILTNQIYAETLGVNTSASITCVKPSGNSSQLLNCSSGLHPRFAAFYRRNVRVSSGSPLVKVFQSAGIHLNPENGQTYADANTYVVGFPIKAPSHAILKNQWSALEQLNYWLRIKTLWTSHNPSITISYKPNEIIDILKWLWEHKDTIGGLSFLPFSDAKYEQMPYIEITEEEYIKMEAEFPHLDFSKIYRYEKEDMTTASQEYACVAGQCEL